MDPVSSLSSNPSSTRIATADAVVIRRCSVPDCCGRAAELRPRRRGTIVDEDRAHCAATRRFRRRSRCHRPRQHLARGARVSDAGASRRCERGSRRVLVGWRRCARRTGERYASAEAGGREAIVFVTPDGAARLSGLGDDQVFEWPRDEDRLVMAFMTGRERDESPRRASAALTSFSTPTIPSTGIPGATKRSSAHAAKTSRSFCRSATRRATGATSWSTSRSRTRRSPIC